MDENVLVEEIDDGVAILTLNRPASLNALDQTLMRKLAERLAHLAENSSVRCVVLTGAGQGFCAGGDLKASGKAAEDRAVGNAPAGGSTERRARWIRRSADASRLLHEMPKPTIAMINGACAGAGLSLAAACDFRFAGRSAKFRSAFVPMGLSGDYGGSWLWTRILGPAKARQLFFLDEKRDADAALAFGLVHAVFPDESLRSEVLSVARKLAAAPGAGAAYAKANLNAAMNEPFAASLDRESLNMALSRNVLVEARKAGEG